jgi:hypothetical protein
VIRHRIDLNKRGLCTTVEFVSDLVGTFVPLKLLWRISLPPKERRLIHGAISASLITAVSGVVTFAFWFSVDAVGPDVQIVLDGVRHLEVGLLLSISFVLKLRLELPGSPLRYCLQPSRRGDLLVAHDVPKGQAQRSSVQA